MSWLSDADKQRRQQEQAAQQTSNAAAQARQRQVDNFISHLSVIRSVLEDLGQLWLSTGRKSLFSNSRTYKVTTEHPNQTGIPNHFATISFKDKERPSAYGSYRVDEVSFTTIENLKRDIAEQWANGAIGVWKPSNDY